MVLMANIDLWNVLQDPGTTDMLHSGQKMRKWHSILEAERTRSRNKSMIKSR